MGTQYQENQRLQAVISSVKEMIDELKAMMVEIQRELLELKANNTTKKKGE